jgi:hypothetical protein
LLSSGGRGWLLKVSHFEMDSKASRERSSSTQTGMLQSQPSPRHYGNPLLVRVTAEETVGVRFRGPASVPCACVDCVVWAARELVACVCACLACDLLCRSRCGVEEQLLTAGI